MTQMGGTVTKFAATNVDIKGKVKGNWKSISKL